jgi:hypothetical protein
MARTLDTFIEFMYSIDNRTSSQIKAGELTQDYFYTYCIRPFVSKEERSGNDKITGLSISPMLDSSTDPLAPHIDIFIPEQQIKDQPPAITNSRFDDWLLAKIYFKTYDSHKVQKEVIGKIKIVATANGPQVFYITDVRIPRVTLYGTSEQTIMTNLGRTRTHWNKLREAILGQHTTRNPILQLSQSLLKDPRMRTILPYTDKNGELAETALQNYPRSFKDYFE